MPKAGGGAIGDGVRAGAATGGGDGAWAGGGALGSSGAPHVPTVLFKRAGPSPMMALDACGSPAAP